MASLGAVKPRRMTTMRAGVLASFLACACGANSSSSPADDGVEGAPVVPELGGETTDFGSGHADDSWIVPYPGEEPSPGAASEDICVYVRPHDITPEELAARGFDPEAIEALIEQTRTTSLAWLACSPTENECPDTEIKMELKLESFEERVLRENHGEPECPEFLVSLRALAALSTADASISGVFNTRCSFWTNDEDELEVRCAAAPDLRNFGGSLQLPLDINAPHWSYLQVDTDLGSEFSGSLALSPHYQDDSRYQEAIPVAVWPAERASEIESSPIAEGTPWITLADYEGSLTPPTTTLEACVDGEPESYPVDLAVMVDGETVVSTSLDSNGCADLGSLPRDATVAASAANGDDRAAFQLSIGTACKAIGASEYCEGGPCDVQIEYSVGELPCAI